MKHIKLFENFDDNPLMDKMGLTFETEDGYEVYFDDNYIELMKDNRVVCQFDYPDIEEHIEAGDGYEVYLGDHSHLYLEFIKDERVISRLDL